jgi:PIN domain
MALAHIPGAAEPVPVRFSPTPHPLLHPKPMLVPIIDANALLVMGCDMVKRGYEIDLVTRLAATGRGNPYIAAHIPGEIRRHLRRLAQYNNVPPSEVARLLDQVILPSAHVVDLEIRDHLGPGAERILHVDRDLPKDNRGDPDDVPTMALAEFLAPAVIITQDSVFTRFGFAGAAAEWIPLAKDLLRMVGIEASLTDAAYLTEFALRLLAVTTRELARQALRHPWLASAALAAALWFCHRRGYLRGERWRENAAHIWQLAQPMMEKAAAALVDQTRIRDALIIVDAPPYPIPEQIAARHLARCGQSLTPSELRDALKLRGVHIPAARLEREMRAHCGFSREPGNHYTLGRPARLLTIGGNAGKDE